MANQIEPIKRMTQDIAKIAKTLSDVEARFLVNAYYTMQDDRKRANNQLRSLDEKSKPNSVLEWLADQSDTLEKQVKRALDKYTQGHKMGGWMRRVHGIGPVLSAGLLAHIDITKAPTAGHIWSFAGLNPSVNWSKGEKRPYNADLKTLCWKIGQSFMKFSNDRQCFYGKIYKERKLYEVARNENGGNKELAATLLPKFNKSTDAFVHLSNGLLPPAHIDARARRYAVKLFLSHMQNFWYELHFGVPAPMPYPIAIMGHAHYIPPPVEKVKRDILKL